MAITRAQQARQMLEDGGPMRKIKGQDHMLAYITPNEADKLVKLGGQETMTPEGILAYPEFDNYTESSLAGTSSAGSGMTRSEFEGGAYQGTGNTGDGVIQQYDKPKAPPKKPKAPPKKIKDRFIPPTLAAISYFGNTLKNSKLGRYLNTIQRQNYLENLKETDPELYNETVDDLAKLGYAKRDVELYGPESKGAGRDIETFTNLDEDQAKSILNTVRDNNTGKVPTPGTLYDDYLDEQMNRFTSDDRDGPQPLDPCKGPNPPAYCFIGQNADENIEAQAKQTLTPRILGSYFDPTFFAADGGIMNADIVGGMMDGNMDEMGRQMYGLGKLVKKATRAVKKIVKSPVGKAAIAYGLTGGLGNLASGQSFFSNFFSPTKFLAKQNLANIFTKAGAKNILFGAPGKFMGPASKGYMTPGTAGLIGKGGSFSALKGITLASVLPLLAGKTDEEKDEFLKDYYAQKLEPGTTKRQMGSEFDFYNYNLAEGGMPSKEPVAKKTMPLIDMGGKEKDYRETGGFVDMGRMERADDVPARLSKNEFVFTADAVRNAGDGDIDKGAEVMYNMMKNLESGGDVSEESQGLEGARNMFQTSQRLGEVL